LKRRTLLALFAAVLAQPPIGVAAHDVDITAIARLFLDQIGERRYVLTVVDTKVPPIVGGPGVLPVGCAPISEAAAGVGTGLAFECEEPLTFDDALRLPWPLTGVVVLASWTDGSKASAFFRGDGRSITVPLADLRAGGSLAGVARRYLVLGAEHILLGIDHLLFVLGLLLLVGGVWPLVKTITAFTVAHSITLGAAVLGWIPVDRAPVEAAIALSVVLLAREVVMGHRGSRHLVHRQPWLVAFAFGLLHGLGFAGALGAIGLRASDIPLALFFFNVGVEAGQLAFVVVLVAAAALLQRLRQGALGRLEPYLGYALGGLATLWLFNRLPAVWGG
jgi:hypothetical protein